LETPVVSNESFADQVKGTVAFIFKAEIVVQVHAALDDLAAAITFHFEGIVSFFRFGGSPAEEIFEEAHDTLSFIPTRGLSSPKGISKPPIPCLLGIAGSRYVPRRTCGTTRPAELAF
jgi:hypothetical protein